jgi:hypothetical protein
MGGDQSYPSMSPKTTWDAGAAPDAMGLPSFTGCQAQPSESLSSIPALRLQTVSFDSTRSSAEILKAGSL